VKEALICFQQAKRLMSSQHECRLAVFTEAAELRTPGGRNSAAEFQRAVENLWAPNTSYGVRSLEPILTLCQQVQVRLSIART